VHADHAGDIHLGRRSKQIVCSSCSSRCTVPREYSSIDVQHLHGADGRSFSFIHCSTTAPSWPFFRALRGDAVGET